MNGYQRAAIDPYRAAYEDRETRKAAGWARLSDKQESLFQRGEGLLAIIRAHFDRSCEAWEASRVKRPHADWEEYVACWLAANGDRADTFDP